FSFRSSGQRYELKDERIENIEPFSGREEPHIYYQYRDGFPVINTSSGLRRLLPDGVSPEQSILSQRRDPDVYPEITYLADRYRLVRIYANWAFGRDSAIRKPASADARNDRLEEDFSNLGLFLNRLGRNPRVRREPLARLKDLYAGLDDYYVSVEGG